MDKRNIILIIIVVVAVGTVLLLTGAFRKQQPSTTSQTGSLSSIQSGTSEVGQKISDFELESFQGEKVKLSQFQGKPVIIDFWAGWCPFCVNEMPELEKIQQEFKDQLVVLGIHRSETESQEAGAKFAKERGVTYTLLKDSTGGVYKTLTGGRQLMPYALYLDKDGKIVKVKAGPKTAEEMRTAVKELLQ